MTATDPVGSKASAAPTAGHDDRRWTPFTGLGDYLGLPGSLTQPIWREALPRGGGGPDSVPAPPGNGQAVLLIPGYLSGDASLRSLHRWFARAGWQTHGIGGWNADCAERVTQRLEDKLAGISERAGPVTLIGHSRGGQLATVLAARHPEQVEQVVTLASPLVDPFAVQLTVRLLTLGCATLTRIGVPGLVHNCPLGPCCQAFFDDMRGPAPRPLTSIYSRTDGIIDWRSARHPDARTIEVHTSHLRIVVDPETRQALAQTLADEHRHRVNRQHVETCGTRTKPPAVEASGQGRPAPRR